MKDILYEDNHLLAALKPHGMLTQSSGLEEMGLEETLQEWIKKRDQKKGGVFLHAVHRLDRPVSGIVLFAKSQKGLSRMNALMREGKIKKIYRAWVEGLLEGEGVLEDRLVHGSRQAHVADGGKKAELSWKALKNQRGMTLVEIELKSGRYHQIRVQLANFGHPVVGDVKYGAKPITQEGILLSHVRMEFLHPVTLAPLVLVSEDQAMC